MAEKIFRRRRLQLLKQMPQGVAIVPTAPERTRNRDSTYPYRYDSYFWYLSGFPEPEAVIVLVGGAKPRSILFCREKDTEREIWDGFRYGPEAARELFHFDESHPIAEFDARLRGLLVDQRTVYHAFGADPSWDARITEAINAVRNQVRAGKAAPNEIRDVRTMLDGMRRRKDATELVHMQRAADIASVAHERAMRVCRPGMHEYEVEAELLHEFRRRGADAPSYSPIVAGGANACVLHYVSNRQRLAAGELLLIDAGCEVEGYASDVTRTFPVNGRFTAAQRELYEIVLAAQAAAIASIRPGANFNRPHEAAVRVIVDGLVECGLITGSADEAIASESYKRFYMHRTSHWLGLDVHDAGDYRDGGEWTRLASGMTLTVEPGIYVRAAPDVPHRFHDIGIRIEDDVVVTGRGCTVISSAPRTVAEIEAAMRPTAARRSASTHG